jgi:hypothetical protein
MFFTRWMPLLMAGAGAYGGYEAGAPGITDLVDVAKIAVTRYELSQMAHHIHLDSASGFALPDPKSPSSFATWIRKSAYTFTGRDPSNDFWGNPYVLEPTGPNDAWRLRSFGPNGQADLCKDDLAPGDPALAPAEGDVIDDGEGPVTVGPSPLGDDLCALVRVDDY